MFGQTSSNTSRPFGGASTGFAPFGASTTQTSAPFGGFQGTSTKFPPVGASTPQTSGSFRDFATKNTTTTQPSQSAPSSTTTPTFGQKFGAFSSPFWAQSTTQSIGNTAPARGQGQGSTVAKYKVTNTQDGLETVKFQSITAMQVYESKSFEELRFEDYQLGNKGGRTIAKTSTPFNPTVPQTPATPTTTFFLPQPSLNPFKTSTTTPWTSPIFTSPKPTPATPKTLFSVPQPSLNPFKTSTTTPWTSPIFTSPTPTPATPKTPFSVPQPSPNPFKTSTTTPWTSPIFTSPTPTPATPKTPFSFPQPASKLFNTPTTESNPSIPHTQTSTTAPAPSPFPQSQPQPQPQPSNTRFHQQHNLVQQPAVVPVPATNPFGTPHATPQMLNSGTVQYGISSIPVVDKPALASDRVSTSLTARHLVRRHIGLPSARRYDIYKSKNATSLAKIPFFSDDADQVPKAPKLMF